MAEKKEKKYVSDNPQLMAEWDWEKNNELGFDPNKLTCGSHSKVWWKCSEGHEWEAIVSNRARLNRSCPYCAGQKTIIGKNDITTTHPHLAREWNYIKNSPFLPEYVSAGSHKKVWWICENGHEWYAQIKSRASGVGCPYCSGQNVFRGFNDLESKFPELAKEWHPTKNGDLLPSDITYGSGKKVWWLCKNGHEWSASICNRTKGRGCPICSARRRTSFPEQAIFYYVKKAFPDAINGYKEIFEKSSMELDIFVPQMNVGIEYDGKEFHKNDSNRIRDARKYDICKKQGIRLIRITDNARMELIINCDYRIIIPCTNDFYLENAISHLLYKLKKPTVISIKDDRHKILTYLGETDVSLAAKFPDIAKEWNYEKNIDLLPSMFHPGSNEKVWWICSECGKEWKTSISERTGHDKTGCPVCALRKGAEKRKLSTIIKNGSVFEKAHHLLAEWNYEKNDISPQHIACTSNEKVWWRCSVCGNEWSATIKKRNNGTGCPQCAKEKRKADKKNTD